MNSQMYVLPIFETLTFRKCILLRTSWVVQAHVDVIPAFSQNPFQSSTWRDKHFLGEFKALGAKWNSVFGFHLLYWNIDWCHYIAANCIAVVPQIGNMNIGQLVSVKLGKSLLHCYCRRTKSNQRTFHFSAKNYRQSSCYHCTLHLTRFMLSSHNLRQCSSFR